MHGKLLCQDDKAADLSHVLLGSQGHNKIAHFEIDGGQAIQVGATAGQLPAVGVLRILQPRYRLLGCTPSLLAEVWDFCKYISTIRQKDNY